MPGSHPRGTVVLSDSSDEDDESVAVTSTRDLEEEEERIERLEAGHRSKHNVKRSSRHRSPGVHHGKEPMGETSTLAPITSAIPSKRGCVECDAS
jgi:hypothetical protein